MIGTFWNLCRACPSMPIDKNRSEYRSTYQWYEYTGPRQEVVKQAPQPIPTRCEEYEQKNGIETSININKNEGTKRFKESKIEGKVESEMNIKRNPIFDTKESAGEHAKAEPQTKTAEKSNTIRVRSRNNRRDCAPSRRSKSEGPPATNNYARYILAYNGLPSPEQSTDFAAFDAAEYLLIGNYANDEGVDTAAAGVPVKGARGNTEYRLQFAWPKTADKCATADRQQLHQVKAAGGAPRKTTTLVAATGLDRPPVPVHKKRIHDTVDRKEGAMDTELVADQPHQNGECETNDEKNEKSQNVRLEFHTEYKKNFRPFSQYDYIAGKFLIRDNTVTPASSLSSGSWYTEVLEMRKKAGEYRHRGWGTELVPQHLAEVYNKQIALWEHVSRHSSLSALTLATTMQKPRALTKEEKSKENIRKLAPHRSRDIRQPSQDRAASVVRKKTEKNEEIKRHSAKTKENVAAKSIADKSSSVGSPTTPNSARSHQTLFGGSPKKPTPRASSACGSPKKSTEPPQRPTSLTTTARKKRDTILASKTNKSLKNESVSTKPRKSSNDTTPIDNKSKLRTGSEETEKVDKEPEEKFIDVEHIVKSPPEPTRVKSPEQMMIKSPEPVNWTIPLDTGRTFTVMQNIPEDDGFHHRVLMEPKSHHTPLHFTDTPEFSSLQTDDVPVSSSSVDQISDKESESVLELAHMNGTVSQPHSLDNSSVKTLDSSTEVANNGNTSESIAEKQSTTVLSPIDDSETESLKMKTNDDEPIHTSKNGSAATSPTDVMHSARDRFDSFWNKSTFNGKESSM